MPATMMQWEEEAWARIGTTARDYLLAGRGHGPLLRVEWRHSQGADERPNKRGDNDD